MPGRGSSNCEAIAATRLPPFCGYQGLHFSHGRWQPDHKHGNEQIIVGINSVMEKLFQLAHENAGLEAIHSQGQTQQFK
jgi:hypothetical protein